MFDWTDEYKRPGFFRRMLHEWKLRKLERLLDERMQCVKRVAELNELAKANPNRSYVRQISAYCNMIAHYERQLLANGIEL